VAEGQKPKGSVGGIPVTDSKRSRAFYERSFWPIAKLKLCLGFGNWDLELLEQALERWSVGALKR
jgi:hypothetical protein